MRNGVRKKIREITLYTIGSNNIKYLRVTLIKQVQNLYNKNLKPLKEETEDVRRWKGLLMCS